MTPWTTFFEGIKQQFIISVPELVALRLNKRNEGTIQYIKNNQNLQYEYIFTTKN